MQINIINNPALHFLKEYNSVTKTKKITKDMLKSNNELHITFDLNDMPNNQITAIYWKFHNINIEDVAFSLNTKNCKSMLREFNYYSLVKPYQFLYNLLNNGTSDKNDYIFMETFTCFPTDIFNETDSFINKDYLFYLLISKKDNFIINNNSYLEYVIQYKPNIDNLPTDLKIIEVYINKLKRPFTNLPIGLEKIIIKDIVDVDLINSFFPKLPFNCKIVNVLDEEIITN